MSPASRTDRAAASEPSSGDRDPARSAATATGPAHRPDRGPWRPPRHPAPIRSGAVTGQHPAALDVGALHGERGAERRDPPQPHLTGEEHPDHLVHPVRGHPRVTGPVDPGGHPAPPWEDAASQACIEVSWSCRRNQKAAVRGRGPKVQHGVPGSVSRSVPTSASAPSRYHAASASTIDRSVRSRGVGMSLDDGAPGPPVHAAEVPAPAGSGPTRDRPAPAPRGHRCRARRRQLSTAASQVGQVRGDGPIGAWLTLGRLCGGSRARHLQIRRGLRGRESRGRSGYGVPTLLRRAPPRLP